MKKRYHRGFTLAELLIVVAIVGILVAIAVPVFGGALERSQEAVCAANRRGLKGALTTAYLLDGAEGYEAERSEAEQYTCPSGGKFEVRQDSTTGVVTVNCSKHSVLSVVSQQEGLSKLLFRSITEFFNKSDSSALDSTGPNYGTEIKKEISDALGISGNFDFRVYEEKADSVYKIYLCDSLSDYTAEDIAAIKDGSETEKVAVTGYYCEINAEDSTIEKITTGTVQDVSLRVQTVTAKSDNQPVDHLVLTASEYKW